MHDKVQLVSFLLGLLVFFFIVRFVRREHIRVEYSILWIATSLSVIIFSLWRSLLEKVSAWMGIYYPPSAIFLIATLFFIAILFHFSIVISKAKENNTKLAQAVGILQWRVEQLEKQLAAVKSS